MLSFPADEVGNHLIDEELLDENGRQPMERRADRSKSTASCSARCCTRFTGVDYVEFYSELIRESGAEVEIVLSNNPKTILDYTDKVLTCDIHSRNRTKRILKKCRRFGRTGSGRHPDRTGQRQRLQPDLRSARF